MDDTTQTTNWLQWLADGASAFALAYGGWLWSVIVGVRREAKADVQIARQEAKAEYDEIWKAHTVEREKNGAFRENISVTVAKLPTRDDLNVMKQELISAITRSGGRDG